MKRRGFTIVELLVVVTVIIVLLGLLTAGWEEAYTYAMRVKCQHNLEQIWSACMMYSTAHSNRWPQIWNWGSVSSQKPWYDTLVATGYLTDSRVTVCPSSNVPIGAGEGGYTSPQTTVALDAINKALNWLNDPANQTPHAPSGGIYWPGFNPGSTALGILAFLGAGHDINSTAKGSPSDPDFGTTIYKALKYLAWCQAQDANGWFYPKMGGYAGYINGTATFALCDAYNMMDPNLDLGGGKTLKQVTEKAVQNLMDLQHPSSGGFYYESGQITGDGLNNTWCFQAMWSAGLAGLIDKSTWNAANVNLYFNTCTDDAKLGVGGVAYWSGRVLPGWYRETGYGPSPWRATAATLAARLLLGRPTGDTGVQNSLNWLKTSNYNSIPNDPNGRNYNAWLTRNDIYFDYLMTVVLWQCGGSDWEDWIERIVPTLLSMVTPVNDTKHFWDTNKAVCGGSGGRVYPTALAAITLEMTAGRYLVGSKYYVSGSHTYGYNDMLGEDNKTASGDTIAVMDYMKWAVNYNDNESMIAPRHGGKMNVIFVDGRCQAFYPEQIMVGGKLPIGMLTPEAGD